MGRRTGSGNGGQSVGASGLRNGVFTGVSVRPIGFQFPMEELSAELVDLLVELEVVQEQQLEFQALQQIHLFHKAAVAEIVEFLMVLAAVEAVVLVVLVANLLGLQEELVELA
jgi:hypothetical protein